MGIIGQHTLLFSPELLQFQSCSTQKFNQNSPVVPDKLRQTHARQTAFTSTQREPRQDLTTRRVLGAVQTLQLFIVPTKRFETFVRGRAGRKRFESRSARATNDEIEIDSPRSSAPAADPEITISPPSAKVRWEGRARDRVANVRMENSARGTGIAI